MKKNIMFLLIGLFIGLSIAVSASLLYNAKDVEFKSNDSTWKVTNVEDAIKDIRNDVVDKKHVIKLTSLSLAYGSFTYDVSKVLSNYKDLTSDNFFYSFISATTRINNASLQSSETPVYYKNYNPETGILTYGRDSYTVTVVTPNVDLYVIY